MHNDSVIGQSNWKPSKSCQMDASRQLSKLIQNFVEWKRQDTRLSVTIMIEIHRESSDYSFIPCH